MINCPRRSQSGVRERPLAGAGPADGFGPASPQRIRGLGKERPTVLSIMVIFHPPAGEFLPGSRTLVGAAFAEEGRIIGNSEYCHKPNFCRNSARVP